MIAVSNDIRPSRALEVTLVVLCLVSSAFTLSFPYEKDSVNVVKENPISLRLPNDTIPIHYDIHLSTKVHTVDRAYEGQVKITIKCEQSTRNVVLHSHELKILTVQLRSNSSSVDVIAFETIERTEFLNITLGSALEVGEEYTLFITFTGEHSSSKLGWYRGSYNDKGEVFFATTHFEPKYARRAFPCYDEPAKKATFLLKITHSNTYHALSNMPIRNHISRDNETTTTTFQVTPRMSVYTLAFLVSDFERNCKSDAKGREHCIYAIPEKMAYTNMPLENSVKAIALYEDLLGVKYSLPKLDHVAIPYSHFPAGAMENWGLVIYNEFNVLIKPSEVGREATSIMMHEIAHQWFGNLVSPKWWSNIWLNEGFATLFQYYATDKLYPDMHMRKSLMNIVESVKETDFYNHRPMTNYTEETSLEAIDNYVDYRKSAGVLLMFMVVLGEDTFLKGLSYYIKDMQYKNAVPDDLTRGLQRAVDESKVLPKALPVKTILDSWHLQGGVPIITASRSSPTTVTLIQHRHQEQYRNSSLSNWYIPLTFTESANVSFESSMAQDWFRGDTDHHEITISADSSWYLLNPNRTFYYQVNYDVNNWQQIAKALHDPEQRKQIPVVNRANLIDDTLQLANGGFLEMNVAFAILDYLRQETDDLPWKPVVNRVIRVKKILKEFLLLLIKDRN